MKWGILNAESVTDHYIGRYCDEISSFIPIGTFDYKLQISTDDILFLGFGEAHLESHWFVEGRVHEMCNLHNSKSVNLDSKIDLCIPKIKIYDELCDEIIFVI